MTLRIRFVTIFFMTKQDLQEQLKEAMKSGDEIKRDTLRMLISAIGYYEIQKGGAGYTATDEDVLSVIHTDAKKHRDSIEQFTAGNRQDLVEKEQKELDILQSFLPEQMGEDEIKKLVEEAIFQTGASSLQDMGKVMGALMPKIKGKADGNIVSRIVREKLK